MTIDDWKEHADRILGERGHPALITSPQRRILALIDLVRKKDAALTWIQTDVHYVTKSHELDLVKIKAKEALELTENLK